MMKIGFAGTPEFAAVVLKALLDSPFAPQIIYTQPDRPAGRGMSLTPSAVKQCALSHQLLIFQPVSLKDPADQSVFLSHHFDLLIVVAYGLILPKIILEAPRLGCINVHASVLPEWRGAAPIQRSIEAGDAFTGVTIMQMDEGLDTGDILAIEKTPIHSTDTSATLHDTLAHLGATLLLKTLPAFFQREIQPIQQMNDLATYAKKIHKTEGVIHWQTPAALLQRRINAFNPWPGCTSEIQGKKIKIWEAVCDETYHADSKPGTIIKVTPEEVWVNTTSGALILKKVQFEGGKILSMRDALLSKKDLFSLQNLFM
jgi:methionyl-tRNA formyltransferase